MEQTELLSENDVNIFGGPQSKQYDSSCQSASLNDEAVVLNEAKVAEESEEKRDSRNDNVFDEKEREFSSGSFKTSRDSKNYLSAIAEMYSSSDEETEQTCPENSTEPANNERKMAEEAGCKEMGIINIGVNPISPQDKGVSLEEDNNDLNSNNLTDSTPQTINMVEPDILKNHESGEGMLTELDSDEKILITKGNDRRTLLENKSDGHTIIEPINDGSKQMEPESDGQILPEPKEDGHTFMDIKSDTTCTILEAESVEHISTEGTADKSMLIESESSDCTLFGSQNEGHVSTQPESNGQTLIKQGRDGHALVEQESGTFVLTEAEDNGQIEDNNNGHIVKTGSDKHTLIETPNDGNGDIPRKLNSEGHTPMETDNEGNILIKSESGGDTPMNTECNKHILLEQRNNKHTFTEPDAEIYTFIEPKSKEGSFVGLERHGDTTACSDTSQQVYAMSSIDKELEMIDECKDASQMERQTECETKDGSSSSYSSSDDESSSSESESSESSSEHDLEDIRKEIEKEEEHILTGPLKTKSELLVKDLPEVPDLDVTIDENVQLVVLGVVFSIVESLVVVKALPQTPALDSDSVLFLENRSCLGSVFETFGPVQTPFYSIRFNTDRDINDKNVHVGDKVFYAPDMMEFSNFVFVVQLKKLKGSDASWEHDEEPPQEVIEYSDDEEESKARASRKKERMAKKGQCAGDFKKESGNSDHQRPIRGGRKRTWQSRGRGQLVNQNENQGVPTANPPSLQYPAYRFPVPPPGDSLPPQASPHAVQRPVFPPQSPFMSHPTQDMPLLGMRHMVPLRGLPPRGLLGMMPQTMGPFPGPPPGPIGNVHIPSSSPSRPMIGAQRVPQHWPVGPPSGFAPRYPMPGPRGTHVGFGLPSPPPPPPPHPCPPPPPPNL